MGKYNFFTVCNLAKITGIPVSRFMTYRQISSVTLAHTCLTLYKRTLLVVCGPSQPLTRSAVPSNCGSANTANEGPENFHGGTQPLISVLLSHRLHSLDNFSTIPQDEKHPQ